MDDPSRDLCEKAPGADEVRAEMLKTCLELNSDVITELWTACGRIGSFLTLRRTANIVAIHKKGAIEDPRNYRPISLLIQARIVVESAVKKVLKKQYSNHEF